VIQVIDFTNPRAPTEVAFYDMAPFGPTGSDNWSAYPYQGPTFKTEPGVPVYASDGVHNPNLPGGLWRSEPESEGRAPRLTT
jgi:hypothetical protein